MKTKTKIKQVIFYGSIVIIIPTLAILGVLQAFNYVGAVGVRAQEYTLYPATIYQLPEITVKRQGEADKAYKYNERVPEEVILNEMNILAERFNLISKNWETILRCEATNPNDGKLDNLICNPNSTAAGLGQYLIRTWYATESWKQYRRARTDYKATLWEMALDLANGEQSKWQECLDITGVYKFINK